jgi:hypothetical protein
MNINPNFIETYDNLLPKGIEDNIESNIFSRNVPWVFEPDVSGVQSKSPLYGFGYVFYSESQNHPKPLTFQFLKPLYRLLFEKDIILNQIHQARLFLQTPSPNPQVILEAIHTDLQFPHWVCIYYVNDAVGDTVFFDNNLQEIKRVSPKKGRMVLFNGNIKHTGSSSSSLRSIINYNFSGHFNYS